MATCSMALSAQDVIRDPEKVRAELAKVESQRRALQQAQLEGLDARLALDLGLPFDRGIELFSKAQAASPESISLGRENLREIERRNAELQADFKRTKDVVEQLQRRAEIQEDRSDLQGEWLTVPSPTQSSNQSSNPSSTQSSSSRQEIDPGMRSGVASLPFPGGETQPKAVEQPVRVVSNLDPVRAQIHGSRDNGLVARALFKAGQALMDRADEMDRRGQTQAAIELDEQAKQRLERALVELEEVTKVEKPEYVDLFYQGKVRELLFRISERREGLSPSNDARAYQRREQKVREPFLAIAARDVVLHDGNEKPGTWGVAAQAAMEHFRWMNLHAGFKPATEIDAITWPGMKEQ